jgi:mannose-6-phosphate isomerase-like protein (cupin superfamily)
MEWELAGESWTDEHPHDEYNYVLEGLLLVSCDDQTVEVPTGSVVRVPAGTTGHYSAPTHARMLAIYGPNPRGEATSVHGLSQLSGGTPRPGPGAPRGDGGDSP